MRGGESPSSDDLRLVNSGTIDRYAFLWGKKVFRYIKSGYNNPIIVSNEMDKLPPTRVKQAKTPKLIVAGMTKILETGVDIEGNFLAAKSTTIIIPQKANLLYLAGLLNSRFINYWYNNVYGGNKLSGGYLRIGRSQIASIPIRVINFENVAEKVQHDKLVTLVESMLDLQKQVSKASGAAKSLLEKQILKTDNDIDKLVYELYGLTAEEIAIVEGQ